MVVSDIAEYISKQPNFVGYFFFGTGLHFDATHPTSEEVYACFDLRCIFILFGLNIGLFLR